MHTIDDANLLSQAMDAVQKPEGLRIGQFKPATPARDTGTEGSIDIACGRHRQGYAVQIRPV